MENKKPNSEIIIYQNEVNEVKIDVRLEDDTVWLTQSQMGELFGKDKRTISEHIGNIFVDGELDKKVVVRKFRTTTKHETFRHLSNQLTLVATVFLSIFLFLFDSNNLLTKLNIFHKILIIVALCCLIISIFFGIRQFFVDYNYFKMFAECNSEVVAKIAKFDFPSKRKFIDFVDDKFKGLHYESDTKPLRCQTILLIIGMTIFAFEIAVFIWII